MTWTDSYTSSQSFIIAQAEARLYDTYGRVFSVEAKKKSLNKWGQNLDLDIATLPIISIDADPTLPTTNAITHLVAASGDTMDVTVEGHYVDASGNLVFHVQTQTLTADTSVALDQPLARASRMVVTDAASITGPVSVGEGSGLTTVHCEIEAGEFQSQHCATSISYRDAWMITSFGAASLGTSNSRITFRLEQRNLFDSTGTAYTNPVWRPLTRDWLLADGGTAQFTLDDAITIPPNSDVRMIATSTANNAIVTGNISGPLAIDVELANDADPTPAS